MKSVGLDISKTKLWGEMREIYFDFPKEIIFDVFNQFNTNSYKLKYKDRTSGNKNRFKFIDKANDSVLKILPSQRQAQCRWFANHFLFFDWALHTFFARPPLADKTASLTRWAHHLATKTQLARQFDFRCIAARIVRA
jgi:hypothetical protein